MKTIHNPYQNNEETTIIFYGFARKSFAEMMRGLKIVYIVGMKRHSLVDLPHTSSLGDHFDYLIDGGRGRKFKIASRNLTCVCD